MPAAGGTMTRSGGKYGLQTEPDDDDDDVGRGNLRSGKSFRRVNRGHYSSIATLMRSHQRIFGDRSTAVLTSE